MLGATTPEGVRARWVTTLEQVSLQRALAGDAPLVLVPDDRIVTAYVNQGRWVADCPCGGGIACWDEMATAACLDCGHEFGVEWPADDERTEAEALLAERADRLRNWHVGESVEQLRSENTFLLGVPSIEGA